MAQEHTFQVEETEAGQRLDRFLANRLSDHSRSRLAQWIKDDLVSISGRTARPKTTVAVGDTIHITIPDSPPVGIVAQEMSLKIIYSDDDIIVIDKEADVVVHPGAGHPDGTLVNGLLHHFGPLSPIGLPERPGVVHRIDKGTSGVLVFARNEASHLKLTRQFSEHSAERLYHALVWDHGLPDEGTTDTFYGRHPVNRRKFSCDMGSGKRAVTHWRVQERLGPCAWVELRLETGRTHQIRVHMSAQGSPLIGDTTYGRRRRIERVTRLRHLGWEFGLKRQALHAAVLAFIHPQTGATVRFESETPEDIGAVLDALRNV